MEPPGFVSPPRGARQTGRDGSSKYDFAVEQSVVAPDDVREAGSKDAAIIAAVLEQIEAVGYEAVELRTIARQARVSLATIYKRFPSRDALLLAAVSEWMGQQVYGPIAVPDVRDSVALRLSAVMHGIFEPWIANPRMLEAFVLAGERPGGDELRAQGGELMAPRIYACFVGTDLVRVDEILTILSYVVVGVMSEYAHGTMRIEEALSAIDLTVRRLTTVTATAAPDA